MSVPIPTPSHIATTSPAARAMLCPFHDGAATLDLLLAELNPQDIELFDAVLDLRTLCAAGNDAEACVAQLFRVRRVLGGRHYLAFYRVRCWAKRALRIEVRAHRGASWRSCEFPLNSARMDEAVNTAIATLLLDAGSPCTAHVRFTFAGKGSALGQAILAGGRS